MLESFPLQWGIPEIQPSGDKSSQQLIINHKKSFGGPVIIIERNQEIESLTMTTPNDP